MNAGNDNVVKGAENANAAGQANALQDYARMIFHDAGTIENARLKFYADPKLGQKAWAEMVVYGMKNGLYEAGTAQEREEAVNLANGLLRGWSMNPVALSLRPLSGGIGSEEQGIDAQYNRLKQLTGRAKAWDVDLGMALLTDDALEAKLALDREETPEQEWQTAEAALDNLRSIGYRTNADWERNKHVTLGREFSPEAFSRTAFGAGVFAGENEVVHLETAQDFAGLPIVGRDDPGFDVERATWHEGSDGEEGRIGYYTLAKEDGDEQIAIPITSGRMVLTSRAELSRRVREGRFTDAVGAEANKDYRDLVAGRMGDGLTEGGKAWLRQYTPDGAGRFAFGGTSRGGVSNFLSVDGANAFRKLSQNDKELIEGIVQLRSPRNDVGSFWATAGEALVSRASQIPSEFTRGAEFMWRYFSTSREDMGKMLAAESVRDAMNTLGAYRYQYDPNDAVLRYISIAAESVPDTLLFAGAGGKAVSLGKLGMAAARAAGAGVRVQQAVGAVLTNSPRLGFAMATLGGYERRVNDYVLRAKDDPHFAESVRKAHWSALGMGAVETAAEFVPVKFAGKWVERGAEGVGNALATGSYRAAAKAGANYIARNTVSLAVNEAVQEAGQEMFVALIDGLVNSAVDYDAKNGTLDGWAETVPLDKIAEDVGRTVLPAVVSSLALTAGTAGASGAGAGLAIHERVAQIKAFNTARNAGLKAAQIVRASREAKGVHMPAYDLTVEAETRANVARLKQRLGRELTDDELLAAQISARERVAFDDMKQLYNQWVSEPDAVRRDGMLSALGLSEYDKANLVSAFDALFAYRAGAQFGEQVANVAGSIRESLRSVGLEAEVETREDGSTLLRFGGVDAPATEIRFVQQVQDPDAEAHAAQGVAPDGVFIRAADGTEVDATQPVNAVIEIQQQSQSGSTFLLGHELAHNLLDILRRTGTLTTEMDTALAERFKDKDGKFDEEAFADAFGAELRDAFTLQEEERIANAPKTKVGRILRAFADTVRGWAYAAFAFRRAKENAQVAQANAPASVLEAFMQRQGGAAASGAQQNQGTAETVNRSESPNSSAQGAKYHIPVQKDVVDAMEGLANGEPSVTLHNAEYGEIEYPIGKMGKGGMGFLHIVEQRMKKDGATLDDAAEIAIRVAESAERGEVTLERLNTKHFDKDGVRAIVAFSEDGNPIVTGYEIEAGEQDGAHRRPPAATPQPHVSSEEVVAALKRKIAQLRSEEQAPKFHIPNPTERFSETDAGKRVVAEVLDALIETNPVFVFDRERAVDAKASASEGSRERLNKARKRLDGIKAGLTAEQWQDVLGTAFEVSGRFDVLGETNGVISPMVRERMAGYLQDIVRNRATMLGRRAYMAGRNFAWRRAREEHSEVLRSLAEKRAKERKGLRESISRLEGDLKDIGREYRELETQAERQQARVNYLSDVIDALNADKADLRERMREAVRAERVKQARKDAVRREVGVTSKQLKDVLGLDIAEEVRRIAYSEEDILESVGRLVSEIDDGFEAWVRYERPDLAEGLGKGAYTAQGNRAYAQTVGDVLKMLGRSLAYGRTRESVLMVSDAVRGVGRDRARNTLEGKLARVVSDLRRSHGKGLLKAFDRAMRSAFAEAGKRLETKPSAAVKRFRAEWEKTVDALRQAMARALEAPKTKDGAPAPEGTPGKVEERISELQAAIDKASAGKVDEEGGTERLRRMATELMFLQRYGGIAHMENPVEAYALMQEAVAFIRDGLFKHVTEWERAYVRAKGLKDAIVSGLEPASGNPKRGVGFVAWAVPSLFDKLKWPLKNRASREAVDVLEREFSRAASFEAKWNREDFARICGMAADAYGLEGEGDARSKAGYEKWMSLVSERKPYWASTLSLNGRTLSRANLIYIYASLRQDDVYKEMAPRYAKWAIKSIDASGNEIVRKEGIDAYLSMIEGELDAGDLALAEMAVKFFADKREPLSSVSERVLGVPVYAPVEHYVPLRVEADVDMTEGKVRQFMLLPNFLKQRVRHNRQIDESESLYGILVGRSRQQNRWMAYADLYLLTRETLGDPEVNARMNNALGSINMRSLNKQIQDVFAGLEMTTSGMTKFTRTTTATIGLGFNFLSATRQLEGLAAWGIDFGVGDTAGALYRAFADLATEEGRARFMREYRSEILSARMDTGNSLEMQQAIATIGGLTDAGKPLGPKAIAARLAFQAYTRKAFAMIKHTDAFVCALGMTGLRPLLEEKWRRLGYSAEEARELADRDLDIGIQRVQQSGRPEYLSALQRAGFLGSLMSMFTGPSALRAGIWFSAANDVQKGLRQGDRALWRKGFNRLAAAHLSALFYAMLNNLATLLFRPLGDDKEDERLKQMLWETLFVTLTGPFAGLAVLGPLANTAVRNVSRWLATDGKKKSNVRYFLDTTAVSFPAVDTFIRAGFNFAEKTETFAESDFDVEDVVRYFLGGVLGTVSPGGKQAEGVLEKVGVLEEEKKKRR